MLDTCYASVEMADPQDASNSGDGTSSDATALQQRIVDLEAQLKKLTDIAGRAQADLQNARSRMEREAGDLRSYATEGVLRRLLPVIDDFQRAFKHRPADLAENEWVKGVLAIEQRLLKEANDLGLRKMDALGKTVDPDKHEVLMTGPGKTGTVVEVFEDGYELNGKVLRAAKVRAGEDEMKNAE